MASKQASNSNSNLKPPRDNLKRVNSYAWPTGHVGHLSEGQTGALDKFKTLSQQKGYYTPKTDSEPASHDDETMLRYLRARKFIPQDAFGQFKETEDWRQETGLEKLYDTIDIEEYEQTRRLYPQWTGRRDTRGIPLYVFEVAGITSKALSAFEHDEDVKTKKGDKNSKTPRRMLRLFALYENLCRFVLPLCAAIPNRPNPETPVSQSSNIVDISKVSLRQFWSLRGHLQDSSSLATAHYPETLDRIFVIGAPGFFNVVWDWAKNWFDPITVAKIQVVPKDKELETLSKFIPVENIPKKYGGKLDWAFGDMPHLEPGIADCLRWKEDTHEKNFRTFPIGPIKWMRDDKGDLVAMAIGSENGKQREKVVAGLHLEKNVVALALSPGRLQNGGDRIASIDAGAAGAGAVAGVGAGAAAAAASNSKSPDANTSTPQSRAIAEASDNTANPSTHSALPNGTTNHPTPEIAMENPAPTQNTHEAPNREGTSATKFVQQHGTHAAGQASEHTPNTTLDGQGSRQAVVEPRTVGQGKKEIGLPTTTSSAEGQAVKPSGGDQAGQDQAKEEEEQQQQEGGGGVVDTVKASVTGAVGVVADYVPALPESVAQYVPDSVAPYIGLDKQKEEEKLEEQEKKIEKDERVEKMDVAVLEEMLRGQSMNTSEPKLHH